MDARPSLLVVGAGAIGGTTAALLKRAGFDVEVVDTSPGYAALINERGLAVSGARGQFTVRMTAHSTAGEVRELKDVVLLATKMTATTAAARAFLPVLKPSGCVVALQNGMCGAELLSIVHPRPVIGCVVGWGATMEARSRLVMTSTGEFIVGYPDREPDADLAAIAAILSSVVPASTTRNIRGHQYAKLVVNSCITSLGALSGLHLGAMMADRKVRRIFAEIIREAMAVADAMHLPVEPYAGRLDFHTFLEGEGWFPEAKRHLVLRTIGFKYRKLKSSSLQSLERGERTEVDFLNGYITTHATTLGVPVPVNDAIVAMIHRIELGTLRVSPANYASTAFDRFN